MRKILISLMTFVLVVGLVGGGAFAYFSDVEQSTGNVFQAGTLDLAVNSENPCCESAVFTFTEVKPCEELGSFDIKFENVGNNPGVLYTCFDYVENDKLIDGVDADLVPGFEFASMNYDSVTNPEAVDMTADEFASLVYVAAVEYKYECPDEGYVGSWRDDLPNWMAMDCNGDLKVSLCEMKQAGPIPYDPTGAPLKASAHITYRITFHLGDSLVPCPDGCCPPCPCIVTGVPDNRPQADGIDGIVSGILLQVGAPTPPTCP